MTILSEKAMLVQLNISQWAARKLDKRATKTVADTHAVSAKAGRYNKSLLPDNDYLANVHGKTNHIRKMFLANTLPWGIEGTHLLPSANFMDFMAAFRKERDEWEYAVELLIENYENLRQDAKRFLGALFDPADYPDESALRRKFKIDLVVLPVPSTDFRCSISSAEQEAIRQDIEARLQTAQMTAMSEVWNRLYDHVEVILKRLEDPSAIFRDSLIGNAAEMCALLPKLNITGDATLEGLRQDVERKLTAYHPDILRVDLNVRKTVADDARAIIEKMNSIMTVCE